MVLTGAALPPKRESPVHGHAACANLPCLCPVAAARNKESLAAVAARVVEAGGLEPMVVPASLDVVDAHPILARQIVERCVPL